MQLDFLLDEKIFSRLDKLGDPFARLDEIMNWSPFVAIIDKIRPDKTQTGKGGRPPIKSSILLKGLLIGEIYNLSDVDASLAFSECSFNLTIRHHIPLA